MTVTSDAPRLRHPLKVLGLATLAVCAAGLLTGSLAAEGGTPANIFRNPADLPPAIDRRSPRSMQIALEAVERVGRLDDGSTYNYWTFNGTVPGPFVRVRVGDTIEVSFKNAKSSAMMHNVDFHAVTGPGGGGQATLAAPSETKGFVFKALNPGLYVYHCATPMHAQHVANGMYG